MSAARVTTRRKAPTGRVIRNRGFFFTIAPALNVSGRRIQADSGDYTVLKFFVKAPNCRGNCRGDCRGKGGGKGGGNCRGNCGGEGGGRCGGCPPAQGRAEGPTAQVGVAPGGACGAATASPEPP